MKQISKITEFLKFWVIWNVNLEKVREHLKLKQSEEKNYLLKYELATKCELIVSVNF